MWITVLMTATEWKNFFRLRCHPAAEKHFQKIAYMTRDALENSVPVQRVWHLPYISEYEVKTIPYLNDLKKISAGRCARLSYLTHEGVRNVEEDIRLANNLIKPPGEVDEEVMHACYDSETDVLTSKGWKNWTEIKGDETFCTLNLRNNNIEYQKATTTYLNKPYLGLMYNVTSSHMSLLVTPEHKMLACKMTTLKGRQKEKFELIPIRELYPVSHAYMKAGHNVYKNTGSFYDFNTLALLGFALGDGYILPRSKKLCFHLKKERKINYLKSICYNLEELRSDVFAVPYPFDFNIYDDSGLKKIQQSLLMTEDNFPIYEGLMHSDGSGDYTFSNNSKQLIDAFCQICVHLSFAFNIKKYGNTYQVAVNKVQTKPDFNKTKTTKAKVEKIENWEGKIYCVTVPNGTLYVRRNGIGVWSGNSPFEHIAEASRYPEERSGPFIGWKQYRKEFVNENTPG
jgi:hypothetical protein